jgi:hypothetical protein
MSYALHPALSETNRYTTGVMMKTDSALYVHKINVLKNGMRRHLQTVKTAGVYPWA